MYVPTIFIIVFNTNTHEQAMTRKMKEARESKKEYVESSKTIREKIQNLKALRDWTWILQAKFNVDGEQNLLQTLRPLKEDH